MASRGRDPDSASTMSTSVVAPSLAELKKAISRPKFDQTAPPLRDLPSVSIFAEASPTRW